MTDIELAVVGAGLMGACAAWAATRRSLSVVVFEQFSVGHDRGSSHGSARIFRRAYPDSFYITMTGQAGALWRELEAETGRPLLTITGGLDFGATRNPQLIAEALQAAGVPHTLLDKAEAGQRWPGIRFDGPVLHHPDAGVIDADATVVGAIDTARRGGAVVHENIEVISIQPAADHVRLITSAGDFTARHVVVAAGAWIGELVGKLVPLPPLQVTQQQIFHFPQRNPASVWPIFVCKDALSLYGLPGGRDGGRAGGRDGGRAGGREGGPAGAIKIAEHDGGGPTTARTRNRQVDPSARSRLVEHVRHWFPGLVAEPFNESTCLYTSTPTEDFLLDRSGRLVICSPCSGHGAKFAPLIGEMAVDLALGLAEAYDRFRLPTR